jgi:hypothetical protein
MGYYAASSGSFSPTFRDNLSVLYYSKIMTHKGAIIMFMYYLYMFCCTKDAIL